MSVVADVIGVSRSNLHERLYGSAKPRRAFHKAGDAAVLPRIQRLLAKRPTYGYRRITALLKREADAEGLERVNHKRVYRIMARHGLLLARRHRERPERIHDGKVVAIRSNLRWCSDGFAPLNDCCAIACRARVHLLEWRGDPSSTRPLSSDQWRTRSRSSTPMTVRLSPGVRLWAQGLAGRTSVT